MTETPEPSNPDSSASVWRDALNAELLTAIRAMNAAAGAELLATQIAASAHALSVEISAYVSDLFAAYHAGFSR